VNSRNLLTGFLAFSAGVVIIYLIFWSIAIFGPIRSSPPCSWVFRTDASNIGHLDGTVNNSKTMVLSYGGSPSHIFALDKGYFTMSGACNFDSPVPLPLNFVFFKATSLEEFYSYNVLGDGVEPKNLAAAIKDDDPFSELYFCSRSKETALREGVCSEEAIRARYEAAGLEFSNLYKGNYSLICVLNEIINRNELDSKCQKII